MTDKFEVSGIDDAMKTMNEMAEEASAWYTKSQDFIHRRITAAAAVALAFDESPSLDKGRGGDLILNEEWGITVNDADQFRFDIAEKLGDCGRTGTMSYHGCLFSIATREFELVGSEEYETVKKALVFFHGRDQSWCGIEKFGFTIEDIISLSGIPQASADETKAHFEKLIGDGLLFGVMLQDDGGEWSTLEPRYKFDLEPEFAADLKPGEVRSLF